MYFIGRVTLFFVLVTLKRNAGSPWNSYEIFLDSEIIILCSHTKFFNAFAEDFTLIHLETYCISHSRIRMKFYFFYNLIRL